MTAIQLALIGGGVIGKRHIKAIQQSSKARLVAIVDPDPMAQVLADECQVPLFDTAAKLLTSQLSASGLQGVIVATPTEHHAAPTLEALEAGLHVLVEKPVMATLEEAQSVIECSEKNARHVLVGHHRRYYSLVNKTREIIRNGELGELVAVTGQWHVRKHADYYAPGWRKSWQAGPVLTNLIHEMDTLRYVCGEVTSLMAETTNTVQGFEKEDAAALVMRFACGALGTFSLSDQTNSPWSWEMATGENAAFPPSRQNAIRFMGTRASLEFPNLVLWQHQESPGDWLHAISPTEMSYDLEDAYIKQIEHFCAVIDGLEAPRITAQDATNTLRATLAVFDAAKTGKRVIF